MKTTFGLILVAGALAISACTPTGTGPVPSGGSAGAEGEAYCETPPTNPDDLTNWNQLCGGDNNRR